MGWFSKKTEKEKLEDKYDQLIKEAYKLSTIDRKASDIKQAEADELLKKIEGMD